MSIVSPEFKMKRFLIAVVCLVVIGLLATGSWDSAQAGIFSNTPDRVARYRVTVTVETPEGIKAGSAVREASTYHEGRIVPGQGGVFYSFPRGEAVTVDLGKRGVLIALLGDQSESEMVVGSFSNEGNSKKIVMSREKYPRVVAFKDPKDPKTAQDVYHTETYEAGENGHYVGRRIRIHDHVEDIFGTGVHIKDVTIESSKDPITVGLQHYLAWLPDHYDYHLDGQRYYSYRSKYPVANSLVSGNFSTMVKRER